MRKLVRVLHTNLLSRSQSTINILFKISIWFHLGTLCLSIAGAFTYLFSVFFRLTYISNQAVFFWLLTGICLGVLAWSIFKHLIPEGLSDKPISFASRLIFVLISVISTVAAIQASTSQTLFESSDFSSFVRLTTQFTQFRGPWSFGAFPFDYISPDRIQLHRNTGPFYPQATHFIVAMTDQALGLNNLSRSTRLVTLFLCTSVLPLLLILLGQSLRRRNEISVLISLSIMFSIFLTYDLRSGLIPAAIGPTLMIFLLVFTISLTSVAKKIVSIVVSTLLLAFVHPSASASFVLLYPLTLVWEKGFSLVIKPLDRVFRIQRKHPALFPGIVIALLAVTIALSEKVLSYTTMLSSFHINPEFDSTPGLELLSRIFRFVLNNFLLFGGDGLFNFSVFILVAFTAVLFRLDLLQRIRISELLIMLVVFSSSLGGATGLLSFAALPSIFWYSTPIRVVHLWTVLVFVRFCRSTFSKNPSQNQMAIMLLLAFTAYLIHLIVRFL